MTLTQPINHHLAAVVSHVVDKLMRDFKFNHMEGYLKRGQAIMVTVFTKFTMSEVSFDSPHNTFYIVVFSFKYSMAILAFLQALYGKSFR